MYWHVVCTSPIRYDTLARAPVRRRRIGLPIQSAATRFERLPYSRRLVGGPSVVNNVPAGPPCFNCSNAVHSR